ncbi:UNVERIFIED_CONTAM: hypothetical protein PYX00_008212 [Menopon gallinae]|uniref:Uncharacterized protein n=1 Tax=Menopon gallinae TaxID=328185 RepID=A0AAW2HM81_9NEOP
MVVASKETERRARERERERGGGGGGENVLAGFQNIPTGCSLAKKSSTAERLCHRERKQTKTAANFLSGRSSESLILMCVHGGWSRFFFFLLFSSPISFVSNSLSVMPDATRSCAKWMSESNEDS